MNNVRLEDHLYVYLGQLKDGVFPPDFNRMHANIAQGYRNWYLVRDLVFAMASVL